MTRPIKPPKGCPLCEDFPLGSEAESISPYDHLIIPPWAGILAKHVREVHKLTGFDADALVLHHKRRRLGRKLLEAATERAFGPKVAADERVVTKAEAVVTSKGHFAILVGHAKPRTKRNEDGYETSSHDTMLFKIGTLDDPKAEKAETWAQSMGARWFKRLLGCIDRYIDPNREIEEIFAQIKGARFRAEIVNPLTDSAANIGVHAPGTIGKWRLKQTPTRGLLDARKRSYFEARNR